MDSKAQTYVDHIKNEVDRSYAHDVLVACLLHKDIPEPPYGPRFVQCQAAKARVLTLFIP